MEGMMTHSNGALLHQHAFLSVYNLSRTIVSGVLMLILLNACQSQPIKRVTIQPGLDYRELLEAYGKPQSQSYIVSTELTRYSWKLTDVRLEQARQHGSSVAVSPAGVIGSGSSSAYQAPTIRRIYCDLTVMINQQNKVVSWEAKGSGCRQILYHQI